MKSGLEAKPHFLQDRLLRAGLGQVEQLAQFRTKRVWKETNVAINMRILAFTVLYICIVQSSVTIHTNERKLRY